MLEKDMYNSWKSRMELYMMNRQHGRMILESVENGPLIWPSIEEIGVTRPKKYSELSATEAIQADCDVKETNIILQGLPPEVYALERECKLYDEFDKFAYKKGETLHDFYLRFSLLLNDMNIYNMKLEQFQKGDDPIDAMNHMMSFLTAVVTPRYPTTNNQLRNSSNPRQQATINDGRITLQLVQGRQISFAPGTSRTYTPGASGSNFRKQRTVISQASGQILHEEELAFLADPGFPEGQATQTVIAHNVAYQVNDLDAYDSDCDELNTAKVALIANLTNYGLDALAEVHNHDNVNNNMINQAVQVMSSSEQSNIVNHSETEITNDSNIIPYSHVNDTLTAKLERYKEQVKVLKEGQNIDLKSKDNGFQNPFYLKKAQQLEPKLYDGNVIEKTNAIVIPDSEETLMLVEESHSKMILKQKDPIMLEKKVNTTPIDYANSMNSLEPTLSNRPTKVEVPKELPKVSMVNTSLKKLKNHVAGFDMVVKERTTATVITEGLWGFEHTKACFRDKIIPFIKALKDLFNTFDQYLIDELLEAQNVFHQMEQAVEQHRLESKTFEEIFQRDNSFSNQSAPSFDQLFELNELKAQSQEKDTVIKKLKEKIKSLSGNTNENKVNKDIEEIETINIELDHRVSKLIAENEHLKQTYNLQEKGLVITTLKDHLRKLKGKALVDNAVTKHTIDPEMLKIDELLTNISKTCPGINNTDGKLVAVTPRNKDKRVRFTEPITSSRNTITKIASTSNLVSNKPMLSSTGVKPSTSASGSQPSSNTKKDKIQQTPSRTAHVHHSKLNANSELKCVKCNGRMLSDNHDLCVLDFINNVNARNKSKSVKISSKRKVWKPTGKVFTNIGYIWRPTGRTFTIVGNACPLTRITTTTEVPLRKPTALENETPKPVVTLVYSRKPRKSKTNVPVSESKVLKYVSANKKEPSTVKFRNDHVAKILGYGDYQIRNVTISRVYYVEGLGHNLFSIGQFCDSNLEVAFRQHTCFIHNLEGVDLLTSSRGNNLYTLSLGDMIASSPICLLHGLVRGLTKLKFEKDHLCSACAMGKSKKKPHKPKSKDTNQEKLYLLHMDLCGTMRVASINGKKYILVIIDDYSRFTWVKCLRSKDEDLDFIIKFLKMIQVRLKVPVRLIKIDNGTEFVNQTLREYYEKVGISHETFVARSPQQNGVIEKRNRTLIEAACTMLIYAKAPLFLWVEAVATACYNQNHSIIRLRNDKTPYELLHDKPPDLSFFHVFGALCYPTNDSENLGKLQLKANIDFDELTVMAFEHSNSGPALHEITPATISSGLVPNPPSLTPFVPPSRTDWDILFQLLFNELLTPPPSVDHPAPKVITLIIEVVAPEPAASTGSPSSTTVDQDIPSPSNSQTTPETQSPIIPNDVEEDNHDLDVAHMNNDPYFGILIPEVPSGQSSSTDIIHKTVHPDHQFSKRNRKWTKDHPLVNIIGELARPVSTRLQLHEQALLCYYDAFLTAVEPKMYKDALTQSY
ncbi:retrovirus-related pol polyprotein from transposon TNT 1-94 [Tanacetum coccineum]